MPIYHTGMSGADGRQSGLEQALRRERLCCISELAEGCSSMQEGKTWRWKIPLIAKDCLVLLSPFQQRKTFLKRMTMMQNDAWQWRYSAMQNVSRTVNLLHHWTAQHFQLSPNGPVNIIQESYSAKWKLNSCLVLRTTSRVPDVFIWLLIGYSRQ